MGVMAILLVLFGVVTLEMVFRAPSVPSDGAGHPGADMLRPGGVSSLSSSSSSSSGGHGNGSGSNVGTDPLTKLRHTFPVHVGDDTETILHPGVQYAMQKPAKVPESMVVPKFWDSVEAYGPGGVREYLGHHGKDLLTPEQASNVGSLIPHPDRPGDFLETIYISVASYRDPECAPTIESILGRAQYPQRIRVAVIDQRDASVDSNDFCEMDCTDPNNSKTATCQYRRNIDFLHVDAILSVGPVFARHLAHRMFRGEYYAMQVDSHIRFTQDWDTDIIGQWKSAKNEYAVLTTYLSDIIGSIDPITHKSNHPGRPIMCKSDYEGSGKLRHLRHGQQPEGPAGIKGEPTLEPFWAAGFSFARGHFVTQVPYDQYLPMVFQGEEISMGLRGFTYGYDYYTAERSVCFHMYAIKENAGKRHKVKLFWENAPRYGGAEMKAMKRLNGIIGMTTDPYDTTDQDKYGLGQIRKPDKFFETFGIHRETQTVEGNLCTFVGKPMQREFKPHLRSNRMGINYDEIDYVFVNPQKNRKPRRNKF